VPTTITLSASNLSFSSLLATRDLTASVLDEHGSALPGIHITWTTDASTVATVSIAGRVTAVGNGTAEIRAWVGTITASATATVQQVAASLTLTPYTVRLDCAGDTATVAATVRDVGGSVVAGALMAWSTLDPGIATVNMAGRVTAVGNGGTNVIGQVAQGGAALTRSVRVEVGGQLAPAYLLGGYMGTAYTDRIGPATGGGTFTYTVTGGALPTGLSLAQGTAEITGFPSASGAYFFEVTATNGVLTLSERYAITISTKPAADFNLWVSFDGGPLPSANTQLALSAAIARWEEVVTGDLGAETYPSSGLTSSSCSLVDASLLNGAFIEDLAILMSIGVIAGSGNTLARAGPCGYGRRTLPAVITGQMIFDQAFVDAASRTYLQDVIWHEMAHVFGIGTLWQGSTTGVGTQHVLYFGPDGNAEWRALGGPADGVPLEPDMGAHWDEPWFGREIMTPFTEGQGIRMPISRVTIGALVDLGWTASFAAADPYALVGYPGGLPVGAPHEGATGAATPFDEVVIERLPPLPPGAVRH
jgi:hypothetical protein